jgi:hypothetical protein
LLRSDDRRLRLRMPDPAAGAAPRLMPSRPAGGGDPVSGAPGWRVTRRAAPSAENGPGLRRRPGTAPAPAEPDAESTADQLGVPACAPRRAGPTQRSARGISLPALAVAAAAVLALALGLIAF